MIRLEDITKGATVRGILANAAVKIIDATPIGSNALKIVYESASGATDQEILYRDREPTLELVESGRPWSFTGDGNHFRLVSVALRIQYAYLFDPVLAVHTSLVEPLPHQITAVYEVMLMRQPLRFLLDVAVTYYDPAQNISRDAESRKEDYSTDAVHERIAKLIKATERDKADFERVHPCPSSPSEVVDEAAARLVILSPAETHTSTSTDSLAIKQAEAYLNSRGTGPRIYRNMVVFAAADHTRLTELEDAVRWSMAWETIYKKRDALDLNPSQSRTAEAKLKEWEGVVGQRISETYCWLIVPTQLKSSQPVSFEAFRLRGSDSIAERSSKKLSDQGALVTVYGSNLLRMVLDEIPLWRGNHVLVKQLCEDFAQYLYLPRLKNDRVLISSVEQGISMLTWADDGFAYAQNFDGDRNRYVGLTAGRTTRVTADNTSLVVKPNVATAQLAAVAATAAATTGTGGTTPSVGPTTGGGSGPSPSTPGGTEPNEPPPAMPKRFYGTVKLDATRLGRDAGRIAEEVLSHLASLQGAKAEVTLDIEVRIPEGVPDNVIRTVTENCRTLKFDNQAFEAE